MYVCMYFKFNWFFVYKWHDNSILIFDTYICAYVCKWILLSYCYYISWYCPVLIQARYLIKCACIRTYVYKLGNFVLHTLIHFAFQLLIILASIMSMFLASVNCRYNRLWCSRYNRYQCYPSYYSCTYRYYCGYNCSCKLCTYTYNFIATGIGKPTMSAQKLNQLSLCSCTI